MQRNEDALIAQLVERFHGKEEVASSILAVGTIKIIYFYKLILGKFFF